MEKTSDSVNGVIKTDKIDLMNYPHIIDELAEWSINLDSKLSADNSYSVAADLLRCRNISLSSVHSSFNLSLDDKLSDNKESDPSSLPKISHHLYNSWRKLSEIMTTWFPPSQVLVTYAHLRENNCPWQLGYLSSESVQGQALCLVATHWLELMELPNKLQSSYSFSIHDLKQANDITPLELIKSTKSFTYVESDIKQIATNHPSRITRKWYLSYVDPCPQWRIVTFVSYKPYEIFEHELSDNSSNSVLDNLYYITAIGYSNGSIDIIDLSVDESEKPDIDQNVRRSRIFITSPFTQSINSLGCKKPLFPIILLSFIDISHLLVGHFRGHVDLWHLDWKAKSFPARMMMRIYPVTAYQTSKPPPLLAAVYDPSSSLLVLSSLPNTNVSKVSKSMHKKLGLTCYYVSRKAPYLSLTSSHSTSDVIPGRLVGLYTSCKDISVQLLSNLFRRSSYLTNDNQDAITSMALTNLSTNSLPIFSSSDMSNQLLLGSLHSSGSYSVWLVPSFELLLLIANPQISPNFSSSPANEDSNVCSRPFQIAWWGRPLEVNEFLNQDIQLCVIHESGSIDLLDIKKSGTEFYPKIARKLNGLKLPQFPVFATHSLLLSHPESCSSEIVLLSSCLKEDSATKADSSHDSSKTIFHHRVRCTRLKSTTHNGLFDHFIRMGKFQKALELSETSKENSEIVYKQMWIRLSTEFWKFKNFEQFIHSTLDSIEMHPLWVIKQCLDYLPRFVPSNVNYTLLISSIRSVLNYGLNMVINNKRFNHKDNIWYSVVKERFLIYLTHLNCLESIIQAELLLLRQSSSSSSSSDECLHLCFVNQITCQPCLDDILEAFNNFRIHSLLDIAFDWAKNQQFIALNILFAHFPNSIGFYRLLIASSLSETINPNLYFHKLFNLNSNLQNNQIADSMIHIQNDDDDNNNHNSIVENIQCQFSMSLCLTMEILKNPLKLVKLLSYWLIERAIQIDTRSGLTDYALNLISLGLSMCEEIFKGTNIDNEMETCLKQLKKVRRDFIELAQIIYNKNVCPTTILQISNDVTSSISREFTSNTDSTNENIRAFQLNITKFQHFNSKSILTLLLRISLNQINFDRQQHTSSSSSSTSLSSVTSDKLVSFVIQHLLPHLAEKCSPSDYEQLINHCLLYAANCIGLTGHQKLLESLKSGCLNEYNHDYLSTDLNSNFDTNDYLNILNPYQLLMGLIYVLKEYKLDCSKVDHHHQQHQQELTVSLLSTYLTDTNHLIQSMRIYCQENKMSILKTVVYEQEYEHLYNTIHLFNQLITALMELVALKQSIEQWIDLSNYASLSFHMIGTFYQCSQNVKYFQNFLNYWIQIFSRFIVFYEQENVVIIHGVDENNNKHNQCRKQLEISEATVKKLNDTFYQFYKILSKAFYQCPSESWLKIGLQYALFTSGNDYFLELSKNFYLNFNDSQHVNLCKTIELSDYGLNQWGMCLLHAIRTYVNTSVPIRSELKMAFHDIQLSTASNQIIDPNERLARHCLSIVDSLRNNRVNWDASILLAFHKEKSLLNASTYLATINTMLSSSSSSNQRLNSFISSPYRLRSLWCHDESFPFIMESSEKKRINLLIHAFMKLIELFSTDTTKSIYYDSVYMENVFDSMTLNNLAESFLITIEQVKQCYIRSMYNYLKMPNSIYPKVYLLNLTYKFLNDLIEHSVELCWLECANWAGYQSELFNSENNFICHNDSSSSNSSNTTTTTVDNFNSKLCSWTYLHALYNIERPKFNRSNKKLFSNLSNIDPMELWSIERYRLHLARYAFTYCTCTDYLNDLTNFIGFCILRLEWISLSMQMLNNNNNQQNERNFKKLSYNMLKQFVKYVSSDSKQSEMANTNHPRQSMALYLPPFYSDSTNCVFSELASNNTMMDDEFAPIDCSNYGFYEHRLWFVFLMNWSQLDQINIFSNDHDVDCNIYHIWCKTILEVASRDTRLAISYTAIGSKFCQFYSSNSVSCLNYMNEVSDVLLPFLELSNITEKFDSTYRIVLVLLCYTLVSIYESNNVDYHPPLCGCFPSGEYLCSKCCLLMRSENFNQKFSRLQKQLVNVFLIVLRESLIRCLVVKFPSIDFVRFRHDQTYREDTIYGLCATHFSFGLQLCACYHLNQLEGVFCRLECLFRDEDCTNNDRLKQMIASIINRIVKLPNGLELLLNRLQQTVYPFLTQFSQIKLFFDVIPNDDDDDDGDSQAIIDGIQIRSHRKLLNILCKLQIADQLFHCVTYQEFIKFLHHSSALHNHPLCIHVKTKSDADVIAKVVEQIQEVNDDDSIEITSLQVGDIYAIFGLKVFYDPTLFESFTEMSDLLKLFKSIAPGNTTNDVARFKNWLNELLYDSEFSKDLSISQRRLVLKSAHTFVSRLNKTIVNSEWSNSGVDEMINGYVSHFEQILYLLNKILFPQENNTNEIDPDGNFHNKYSLPKELYKKLISMKPSNQLATVDCLKELIFGIINNVDCDEYNKNTDSVSVCLQISTKLQILGCLLPPCLKILEIKSEIWLTILQESLSVCFSTLSSIYTVRFEYFAQINFHQHELSTPVFTTNTQIQTLYPHVNDFLNLFIKEQQQQPPAQLDDMLFLVDSIQLLSCFLSNDIIRRLFGQHLFNSYSNTDNDWEESNAAYLFSIFVNTIKYYLQNSFCNSTLLSHFYDQLLLINVDSDEMNEFKNCIKCLFQQNDQRQDDVQRQIDNGVVVVDDDDDSFLVIKENVEILRTIIELIDLIVTDDMLPEKCDFLQHLWILWYEYCEKSGLVFIDNGLFNSELLIDQWTKFCIPPVEFAKAGLKMLTDYYTTNKPLHSYPPTYQAAILSVALIQSNSDVIHSALSILSTITDQSIIQYLDTNVCCYFLCTHPRQWLNLINQNHNSNAPVIYQKLFSKIFNSLIDLLQFNHHNQAVVYFQLGRNICLLLRNEDLWLEMAQICMIIHRIQPGRIPMQHVMKLVSELEFHEC